MEDRYQHTSSYRRLIDGDTGAIGYIALWILGVPASLLFLVFLVRGCN